jgi:hypothetical protein
MGMATKRAMATTVVDDKKGNGDGSKSSVNCNKGGWKATAMRAMAMRVAGEQQ